MDNKQKGKGQKNLQPCARSDEVSPRVSYGFGKSAPDFNGTRPKGRLMEFTALSRSVVTQSDYANSVPEMG